MQWPSSRSSVGYLNFTRYEQSNPTASSSRCFVKGRRLQRVQTVAGRLMQRTHGQSSMSKKAALMAVFVFRGGTNASNSVGSGSLIEGSVQIATPPAPKMLAGAEVAARLVVAWIGLASHSSFAIGSGATCMFAHQFVSLPW